jgi:hypothetical protein
LLQPEAYANRSYTERAYGGALLLSLFINDVHLIRCSLMEIKGGIDDV